jgi:hypothetical protein
MAMTAKNCARILSRISFWERLGVPPLAMLKMPIANMTATTNMPTIDIRYNMKIFSLYSALKHMKIFSLYSALKHIKQFLRKSHAT